MRDKSGYLIDDFMSIAEPTSRLEDTAECRLWRGVIIQAVIDSSDHDKKIREESLWFINSLDILDVIDRAMIDRSMVGKLRAFVSAGKAHQFRSSKYQVAA